jgi:hypothetical protein
MSNPELEITVNENGSVTLVGDRISAETQQKILDLLNSEDIFKEEEEHQILVNKDDRENNWAKEYKYSFPDFEYNAKCAVASEIIDEFRYKCPKTRNEVLKEIKANCRNCNQMLSIFQGSQAHIFALFITHRNHGAGSPIQMHALVGGLINLRRQLYMLEEILDLPMALARQFAKCLYTTFTIEKEVAELLVRKLIDQTHMSNARNFDELIDSYKNFPAKVRTVEDYNDKVQGTSCMGMNVDLPTQELMSRYPLKFDEEEASPPTYTENT